MPHPLSLQVCPFQPTFPWLLLFWWTCSDWTPSPPPSDSSSHSGVSPPSSDHPSQVFKKCTIQQNCWRWVAWISRLSFRFLPKRRKSNSVTISTGFVIEATDDLNASFYMAGGFFVAAGIISQIAYFMQRLAKKKKWWKHIFAQCVFYVFSNEICISFLASLSCFF